MSVEFQDWFKIDGDNTLALDWPGIGSDSIVWEIGGYEGRWTAQMSAKYDPFLFVFEPQDWAYERMKERFQGNEKIKLYQFALWTHDGEMKIGDYEHDGASLLKPDDASVKDVLIVDAYSFFLQQDYEFVDVCLMNIEGGEFVLLPYMIGLGMMKHINYFWLQWHLYVKDAWDKIERLHEMLSLTHDMFWDCGSTAQAWRKR